MYIAIPFEGRVRTLIRSSFLAAKRTDATHYSLTGESFQMSGVTAEQVILLPDSVEVSEGQEVTDELLMQALPVESFITVSADEALPNVLGLLLRQAVADGRISDAELLSVQPVLDAGIAVQVGDVFTYKGALWRCIQPHTTQDDWAPDLTPALWHRVEIIAEDEVRVWAAGIDYIVGDEVAYPDAEGELYICLQAHERRRSGRSTCDGGGDVIRQLTAIDKVEIGREKSMPEWITRYWVEWLFGIVAALAAASYRRVSRHMRHTQKKDQALDDGMRALLRDRIISACDHYFEKGFAPVYARENITSMYDAYHSLGGDGIVTDMVKQAMELPYKKGNPALQSIHQGGTKYEHQLENPLSEQDLSDRPDLSGGGLHL